MSLLVIGLSHHSAPMELLDRLEAAPQVGGGLALDIVDTGAATEALVVSTCNRLEVYAEVAAFHPAVAAIGAQLAAASGLDVDTLTEHLYVRYDDRAVAHAFSVAAGLDSMAVGESQILGQLRTSLRAAQRAGVAGEALNSLFQQALRVGKRVHSETDIDRHSTSLVEAGLEVVTGLLGPLPQLSVAVIGAGGMSGLAVATLARKGVDGIVITNRTHARAERLAAGVSGHARPWSELADVLAEADVVLTSTGAAGQVVTAQHVAQAAQRREHRPQVLLDLAVPHDVAAPELWQEQAPATHLVTIAALGAVLASRAEDEQVARVRDLVDSEVLAYQLRLRERSLVPTVAALRARAAGVVDAEMARLDARLHDISDAEREQVHLAVHRIVEKLLHGPTQRIKQMGLQGGTAGDPLDYVGVLRQLFDLDPAEIADVAEAADVPSASRVGAIHPAAELEAQRGAS